MSNTPLLLPTLVVLAVIGCCWRANVIVAVTAAGCAGVLLTACFVYPGWSAQAIVDFGSQGFAVAVSLARVLGSACFLYSVVLFIRLRDIPW